MPIYKRLIPPFTIFAIALAVAATLSLAACGAVLAADTTAPAVPTAPQALAGFLNGVVFPLVTALFMGFLTVFLNRLGTKYKLESLTQRGNLVEQFAYQGITLAEEKASQLLGSKSALTGSDKLDIAIAHVLSMVPGISRDQADQVIHAILAQIPGIGATGDTAVPTPSSASLIGTPVIGTPVIATPTQP